MSLAYVSRIKKIFLFCLLSHVEIHDKNSLLLPIVLLAKSIPSVLRKKSFSLHFHNIPKKS